MTDRKQEISLARDFDAVVHYGATTIELKTDGSVVVNHGGKLAASANDNATTRAAETAFNKIMRLAEASAREHKHASITFNHLLAAVLEANTDVQFVLNMSGDSKISIRHVLSMLETDLKNAKQHPQDLAEGGWIGIGPETMRALKIAQTATKDSWRSDRLFGAELIQAMIRAGKIDKSERSTVLDFIQIRLSQGGRYNPPEVLRKNINSFAAAFGENLSGYRPENDPHRQP